MQFSVINQVIPPFLEGEVDLLLCSECSLYIQSLIDNAIL